MTEKENRFRMMQKIKSEQKKNTLTALTGGVPESVPCWFRDCQMLFVSPMGERPPLGETEGYDAYGVHLTASAAAGGAFTPTPTVPPVLRDITEWKTQVKFPDYDSVDWEAACAKDLAAQNLDRENKVIDMFCANGLFERMHYLMGFEETLCALYEEPEAVMELAEAIADTKISLIKHSLRLYRPDVFTFLDDYAHQDGLFMSLEMYREFFKPQLKRIVDAVHEEGVLFKMHCCGKMQDLAQDYMDLGIDALDPVMCMNDIPGMKEIFGHKVGIVGGLDVQNVIDNVKSTPKDVRKEVRRCIDSYAPGGGYMLYCASVNVRNQKAWEPDGVIGVMIDECGRYGNHYYKK